VRASCCRLLPCLLLSCTWQLHDRILLVI
jgi:hypothetical protein